MKELLLKQNERILLLQSIKKEIPILGKQAREEIIVNWSAKKEADHLMELYESINN